MSLFLHFGSGLGVDTDQDVAGLDGFALLEFIHILVVELFAVIIAERQL